MQTHDDLLSAFILPLEQAKLRYFITGSVAAIFYGETRLTHNIDFVLHVDVAALLRLRDIFPESEYYCPPEEVLMIEHHRKPYGAFNLIQHRTGLKADIYLEGQDHLHAEAFRRAKKVRLGPHLEISLAPPEYLILRKLEFFREGGSDKHLQDIRAMLSQVSSSLDFEFLNHQLKTRDLEKQWQQVKPELRHS